MCEYYTHRAGGLLAGAAVLQLTQAPAEIWPGALILAVVASAIPDLDHNQSTAQSVGFNEIKSNVPIAGNIITRLIQIALTVSRKYLGKRGATHSLLMAMLVWWAIQILWTSIPPPILYSIVAGYVSHLIVDMFNPEGVRLFWPVGPRISLAGVLPWPFTFKTGSRIERFVFRPVLWISSLWIILGKTIVSNIY